MTPFRERNPVTIGAVGLLVIAAMLLLAFNTGKIPLLAGRHQSAALSEAGGLKPGDDVRIAGVKVGKITSVDLEKAHVRVDFTVSRSTALGSQTGAAARIVTSPQPAAVRAASWRRIANKSVTPGSQPCCVNSAVMAWPPPWSTFWNQCPLGSTYRSGLPTV